MQSSTTLALVPTNEEPQPEQKIIQEKTLPRVVRWGGALISLGVGTGSTVRGIMQGVLLLPDIAKQAVVHTIVNITPTTVTQVAGKVYEMLPSVPTSIYVDNPLTQYAATADLLPPSAKIIIGLVALYIGYKLLPKRSSAPRTIVNLNVQQPPNSTCVTVIGEKDGQVVMLQTCKDNPKSYSERVDNARKSRISKLTTSPTIKEI